VRQVVVDASVVVAGLLKDGTARDALLSSEDVAFVAPGYLSEEVDRHLNRLADRSGLPVATIEAVLQDLLSVIELVPEAVYAPWIPQARAMARTAHAQGDEEYIALSLALAAPIWAYDRDFSRIPGIKSVSTRELEGTR
jgi:predicted nucleic acid-binding protein